MRRVSFPVLRVALTALVGLVVVVALGLVVLTRTDFGRAEIVRLVERFASSDGMTIRIGRLEGALPAEMRVRDVTIADPRGVWLSIDQADLRWRPLALISGRLDVELVRVGHLDVARAPDMPPAPAPAEPSSGMPQLPFGVSLQRMDVTRLTLGEPLLGVPAALSLTGMARLVDPAQGLVLDMSADRVDDTPGRASIQLNFRPDTQQLKLAVDASEPPGGLVSRLAALRGEPPISLNISGDGPLDDWSGRLRLTLGDKAGAEGEATLKRSGTSRSLDATLLADVGAVLPEELEPLVGPTTIKVDASFEDDGAITLRNVAASNTAFALTGDGVIAQGGAVAGNARLSLGEVAPFAGFLPKVPGPDGRIVPMASWQSLVADLALGGTVNAPEATLKLAGRDIGITAAGGRYDTGAVSLNATVRGDGPLIAEATRFAIKLDGIADALSASDKAVASALGPRLTLAAEGTAERSGRLDIAAARIEASPIVATYAGQVDPASIKGKLTIERADMAALRGFVEPDLSGQVQLTADVDAAFDMSRLIVTLDGAAQDLKTGIAIADNLLGGRATVKGTVRRAGDGSFGFETFSADAAYVSLTADGSATDQRANVVAKIALPDLQRLDPRVSGRGDISANLTGSLSRLDSQATIQLRDAKAMGRPIERLVLNVTASDVLNAPQGELKLDGSVNGKPARGSGQFARKADGASDVRDLDITLGSVAVRGSLSASPASLVTGQLAVTAGDLRDLAPLVLAEIAGRLELMANFDAPDGKQAARITGSANRIDAFGVTLTDAKINATGRDLFKAPAFNGQVDIDGVATSGLTVSRARLTAEGEGNTTDVNLNAVVQGADLATSARITPTDGGIDALIRRLTLSRGQTLSLSPDARISLRDGTVTLSNVEVRAGAGRLTVAGSAGERLDVRLAARAIPLAIAELFAPGLGVTGALNGDVTLSGTAAQPSGRYNLTITNLTAPQISDAGLRPLGVNAEGTLGNGRVNVDARVTGLANSNLQISGSAPLGAGALDLGVNGRIDLGLMNARLSAAGQTLTGQAIADLRIRGTAAAPTAAGTVRITNGRFQDAANGVTLTNIEAVINGSERELVITSLTARARNGGAITGSGRVALDPAAGFPGQIAIKANNAQLMATPVVNATANADLAIAGALATRPSVTGFVEFSALEITLPKRFPFSATPIPVTRVNAPPAVRARVAAEQRAAAAQAANPFAATLDIRVAARSGIVVRGQGINAQLGGQLTIRGTSASPQAEGAFTLRRGTLSLLGRQLTFTRGEVSLDGDFDPRIDFEAESTAAGITARILVTGKASNPQLEFSSSPELPRDEVLARLLFGRPSGSLSTGQAIQLAQALAELTGEGGGPLGAIGSSLGLDSIDLGTTNSDGSGGVAVGIGKQINDRMRLSIKQGATPESSRAAVDIDLGRNIKLEAEAGAGGGAVGIGMEWNY
ncbi:MULTISPECIES: translocation/assembly module TamB domain-containing protein [unclassified Chelatococcus]|uniref:translocation/assembly module TamB domain-containing protein n=1 Tax=unclassified Chelatococcus TaxID=2638111 RepID=UPI001BCBE447|nr:MULTISPECIES: translocation/assembly module TamB domain-containing protein [unclassified Chelatococcus]MBS7697287.1 translocation/assembly module TamB domain-containing protein [Chelatococcus sp. YT9]MBX3556416.1 translocation/assembly module TamB domain-containing protein [Chelatococcus sp.]